MQPTASKTALLFQCGRPFWPNVQPSREGSEASEYGTAFHLAIAERLKGNGVDATTNAQLRAVQVFPALDNWLRYGNALGINFRTGHEIIEEPMILNTVTQRVRFTELDVETHVDTGLGEREIGGTVDYASVAEDTLLILDHKTGAVDKPLRTPQLLTLAWMLWQEAAQHGRTV